MGELVKILEKRDVAPGSSKAVEVRGRRLRCSMSMELFMRSAIPALIALVPYLRER